MKIFHFETFSLTKFSAFGKRGENAALCLPLRMAFSRPQLQFFTIHTDPKLENNLRIFPLFLNHVFVDRDRIGSPAHTNKY